VAAPPDVPWGAEGVRILIASPTFAPQVGGAETWSLAIARGLLDRDHSVEVVARAGGSHVQSGPVHGIRVLRVPGGRLAFARAIRRRVDSSHPDVVIAQYSALPAAVLAGRRAGVPVVGVVHDVYGFAASVRIKGPVIGPVRHVGLEQSLRVLAPVAFLVPSRSTARRLVPLAGGRAITVVPAGADVIGSDTGAVPRDPERVVFVGRLVPQKGAADLVEAIRILVTRSRSVHAVVVGEGPQSAALRHAAAGLPVRFDGRVPDRELDELLLGSLALVLPSTREGWGLAVTEAAARGLPYVAYDIPAVREQHEELRGGLLVAPGPGRLADALASLLDDPGRAAALGATGRAAAAGRSWATAAEVVEAALEAVVR